MSAIEADLFNPGLDGLLGQRLAHGGGGLFVAPVAELAPQRLLARTGRDQSLSGLVIDQLAADVLQAAMDAHSRPLGRPAQAVSDVKTAPLPSLTDFLLLVHGGIRSRCVDGGGNGVGNLGFCRSRLAG
jgi:hypothetical protein